MNYNISLLYIIVLFIGANLFCSCCQFPIFDFIMGNTGSPIRTKEGLNNNDVGPVGSGESVKKANEDIQEVIDKNRPKPPGVGIDTFLDMQGIPAAAQVGINVLTNKEAMTTMGSDINEVQNGDVAGMWVSKANTYASEFGYGIINNSGSAYSADEPLKNGEMVIFAKNKFKPECCPAPYSSSTGCVCMTPEQIHFLNTRGGNRTSDSGV